MSPIDYYAQKIIQTRIAEYCGGWAESPEAFTTEFLAAAGEGLADKKSNGIFLISTKDKFPWILENGLDIFRSHWDRENTLSVLDLEYFNLDFPGEAYFQPEKTFRKLEPVYEAALDVFYRFGIMPLVIMTGQGYHFPSRIRRGSKTEKRIEEIGKVAKSLAKKYAFPENGWRYVSRRHGQAFDGMGRLMEYITHLLIKHARRKTTLPLVCTDVAVGKGPCGREAISLDLSMYGDPLHTRAIRCAFSTYQKHRLYRDRFGENAAQQIPIQLTLPRLNNKLDQLLSWRLNFDRTINYAKEIRTIIPDATAYFGELILAYKHSLLCHFHQEFDRSFEEEKIPKLEIGGLPACIQHCLLYPNDHLLKPTNVQTLTRILLKQGWLPGQIVNLITSKYEQDYDWQDLWKRYDTSTRASFYVRIFSGLIACGLDKEIDLNCVSHQEKGYCVPGGCKHNLADYRL
ncbi:MAG: hypothetical protein ABII74_07720 [Elusimicrobiota bacterium]